MHIIDAQSFRSNLVLMIILIRVEAGSQVKIASGTFLNKRDDGCRFKELCTNEIHLGHCIISKASLLNMVCLPLVRAS